jgi:hypothetical protein
LGREAGALAVTHELVAVAQEEGLVFTKMGEPVHRLGAEVKSLNSGAHGGAAAVTARSGRPRVADGGLLGEEIESILVHFPR